MLDMQHQQLSKQEQESGQEQISKGEMMLSVIRLSVIMILLCGIIYPLVSTGIAQVIMPSQANGSLLKDREGRIVGSELIGQNFRNPALFHSRVSSIEFKAEASGSNNYGPSNPDMLNRIKESIRQWEENNPDVPIDRLPVDLVTNSGSGLDPHITPESAQVQVPRISRLTGIPSEELESLVQEYTEERDLGLLGERRVNVLKLNLALTERYL